jgi:hypothetical protein
MLDEPMSLAIEIAWLVRGPSESASSANGSMQHRGWRTAGCPTTLDVGGSVPVLIT